MARGRSSEHVHQCGRRYWRRIAAGIAATLVAVSAAVVGLAGFLDRDPMTFLAPEGRGGPVAALYFSGDMGLRVGIGPYTSAVLAKRGIAVVGFSSPAAFARHRTRVELDAAVAAAVRQALAHAGGARMVLIGQSYGADILQTGLADLPTDLRPHIVAVVLVVPGRAVFFRADPSGLAYHGTPDSLGASTINAITWAPLTCIYGAAEIDSLCPAVRLPGARIIRMPGGHFLANDRAGVVGYVVDAIRRAAPAALVGRG